MNTPLEVMKAIVDNGGPVEAWVRDNTKWQPWQCRRIIAVYVADIPFRFEDDTREAWRLCSLTDPNANYVPIPTEWTHGWASWRAVDKAGVLFEYSKSKPIRTDDGWINGGSVRWISKGHDPTNWKDSLEERPRKTRPMTAREAALFLHGQPYVVKIAAWKPHQWVYPYVCSDDIDVSSLQYTDPRDPDFPQWKDFPEVEA